MATLFDLSREDLAAWLAGEPPYRLDQVWHGLYREYKFPSELTTLPAALRASIAESIQPALRPADPQKPAMASHDGSTVKWLWELPDGARIETVLMHYRDRSTVCISTQAGCAMACSFCATGQVGFERNLSSGEMVEQVIRAARAASPRRIGNVVFMGMGEPLANYEPTWSAVERLHDDVGISARHLTISTVGVVPGIRRIAREGLPVNLAVSLHAANDELRDGLVPINRSYPLDQLAAACQEYVQMTHRRLSFEWAMIDGVNDGRRDVAELAAYAKPLGAHVNLIPLNPTPGYGAVPSPMATVAWFRERLRSVGVNATVRQNRGTDIEAACGQLRAEHKPAGAAGRSRTVNVRAQ